MARTPSAHDPTPPRLRRQHQRLEHQPCVVGREGEHPLVDEDPHHRRRPEELAVAPRLGVTGRSVAAGDPQMRVQPRAHLHAALTKLRRVPRPGAEIGVRPAPAEQDPLHHSPRPPMLQTEGGVEGPHVRVPQPPQALPRGDSNAVRTGVAPTRRVPGIIKDLVEHRLRDRVAGEVPDAVPGADHRREGFSHPVSLGFTVLSSG